MPGQSLNLSLPSLSDTMATIVSKTATALSAIQTDLTPKITPPALNINASLSVAGNALTNIGSLQMVDGNQPTNPGSLYYHNGEFFLVDTTGTIQVTTNGVLNVAGVVGIIGDYGGSNPARVIFNDTAGEFRFQEDQAGPIWADVVCDDLVLEGASGTVRFNVDAAISGGKTINIKSLNS